MKISKPELKVVLFKNEDVIATSNYYAVLNGDHYDIYTGYFGAYDPVQNGNQVYLNDTIVRQVAVSDYQGYKDSISRNEGPLYEAYSESGNIYYSNHVLINSKVEGEGEGGTGFVPGPPIP
jgi:hypothetical protein